MKSLEVVVTIHATSEWNERKQRQGHCDSPLSDAGRQMAKAMAQREDLIGIRAIFSSDLARAHDTAWPLSQRLGLPIRTDPLLREKNWEDYYRNPDYPPLPFDGPFEDDDMLTARACLVMDDIARTAEVTPILIVTHGAFLQNFLAAVFPDQVEGYAGRRTALNRLRWTEGQWSIVGLNDDSHLV